jgi:hypothetical protein
MITVRSTGASGTVIGGIMELQNAVLPDAAASTATVAVDTTVANLIEFTFISGNAANTYTFQVVAMELVKQ